MEIHNVSILRPVSPGKDLAALFELFRSYKKKRFQAVVTMTPKAGLLGMMAARFAGIPVRIHCFTGQVWANRRGFARVFLKAMAAKLS